MAGTEPTDEISPQIRLTTEGGTEIDFSGMDALTVRLQVGAADELTLVLPAQDSEGAWRSDMPMFQNGGTIVVEAGYNGEFDLIQKFEIVSTTTTYGDDAGGEKATCRGVSDLARCARNKVSRVFDYAPRGYGDVRVGADTTIISKICAEYGWTNGCTGEFQDPPKRVKENGTSDLELLKRIANEALIGGPRLRNDGVLIMPEPIVGDLQYLRGPNYGVSGWRRLHNINANREGAQISTRVIVVGWDPEKQEYVETEFMADEFGGDPKIVYEGPQATKELTRPPTTQGLVLSVIEHRGQDAKERVDVISSGRYTNETNAVDLAKRWFLLREKLGKWADLTVDGNAKLLPYVSVEIDGDGLAMNDRGTWLPMIVTHSFTDAGWSANLRCIRVVDEPVVTPVSS